MLTVAVAILLALIFLGRLWLLPAHLSVDPNEGWNAFQSVRALGGGPLYPAPASLAGNNYPPLSFYVVGAAGRLVGDPLIAGRLVAFLALFTVAGSIYAGIRKFGSDRNTALVGASLFLAFNATLFRSYVGLDDPQWLAHALMTAGFVLLIEEDSSAAPTAGRVVAAALLMLLGGLVKHTLIAFPCAATLWLFCHHRRLFVIWVATAVAGAGVASLICYAAYGPDVFTDILFAPRAYSWLRMAYKSALPLAAFLPMIVMAARLVRQRGSDTRLDLLIFAAAISVALGIFERGGAGIDRNAHFEALIALCLTSGVVLVRDSTIPGTAPRHALAWLGLPVLLLLPPALFDSGSEIVQRQTAEKSWREMETRIAQTPGAVACEMPALCFWAGKNFALDFFLTGQRILETGDAATLRRALDDRIFAAVQLNPAADAPLSPGERPNPIEALVVERYQLLFTDAAGRRLLAPPTP